MPSVTLVIPVYNGKKFLSECLDSVICQTYSNIRVIIVDDGSTDGSSKICDDYCQKYPNFTCVHKKNGGVSSARNVGIENSNTDLIGFIDCDDTIERDYVEKLVSVYCKYGSPISTCGYRIVSENNKIIKEYEPSFHHVKNIYELSKCLQEMINKKFILSPCCKLFRLNTLKTYSIKFDETLIRGEDLIFNLSVLQHVHDIGFIQYSGYFYKMHDAGTSLCRSINEKMIDNASLIFDKCSAFCNNLNISKNVMYLFVKYYFKSLIFYIENMILLDCSFQRIDSDCAQILSQKSTRDALHYWEITDFELMIYHLIFALNSTKILYYFTKSRIVAKKFLRGY